jgi:chemotaxis protein CheX
MTNPQELISQQALAEIMRTATLEVFSTMLNLPLTAFEVRTESTNTAGPRSGIVALIGVAGAWAGTGCVACSGKLACRLSEQFLMTPFEAVNEDVLDAVGEITNMIIGNVKTHLEEIAGAMGLSTPTVIYGRNFQTRSARVHEWTVVPFECEGEALWIQMCLMPNQENRGTIRAGFQLPQMLNI